MEKSSKQPTALIVCGDLRPIIYKHSLGIHWPFAFNVKEDKVTILIITIIIKQLSICKTLTSKSESIPVIYLSLGKVTDDKDVPEVIYRLNKKTSQGKIFVVKHKINDADVMIVVKADTIKSQDR
jgi:hypothetical protein